MTEEARGCGPGRSGHAHRCSQSSGEYCYFELPPPTGGGAGGEVPKVPCSQTGRGDDKRQTGPKAPIPHSFNKNKDSLSMPFSQALFCQGEQHRLTSSLDLENPSLLSPPLSHFLYLNPQL